MLATRPCTYSIPNSSLFRREHRRAHRGESIRRPERHKSRQVPPARSHSSSLPPSAQLPPRPARARLVLGPVAPGPWGPAGLLADARDQIHSAPPRAQSCSRARRRRGEVGARACLDSLARFPVTGPPSIADPQTRRPAALADPPRSQEVADVDAWAGGLRGWMDTVRPAVQEHQEKERARIRARHAVSACAARPSASRHAGWACALSRIASASTRAAQCLWKHTLSGRPVHPDCRRFYAIFRGAALVALPVARPTGALRCGTTAPGHSYCLPYGRMTAAPCAPDRTSAVTHAHPATW